MDVSRFPDFSDQDFASNPYPYYAYMREEHPVHWSESLNAWVLLRYADIVAIVRDNRISSASKRVVMSHLFPDPEKREEFKPFERAMLSWFVNVDPPHHTRLRGIVSKAFTPRVVEGMRAQTQRLVDELLDGVQNEGRMDVITDLAFLLPTTVISEMLGVPAQDHDQFKQWSGDISNALGSVGDPTDTYRQAQKSLLELSDYLRPIASKLRTNPRDDLMSALVMAEVEGDRLTEEEFYANCVMLLWAGHETTTNLIGNGLLALMRHHDQLEKLTREPFLIKSAIEELLRYDPPLQSQGRIALEDIEIGGKLIEKGQRIVLHFGAANRDPEQFEYPDRLDITRCENKHLSFSHGIHYCLGAALARLEGEVAIGSVLRRMPDLRLDIDVLEWAPMFLRGVKSLPVVFEPAYPR